MDRLSNALDITIVFSLTPVVFFFFFGGGYEYPSAIAIVETFAFKGGCCYLKCWSSVLCLFFLASLLFSSPFFLFSYAIFSAARFLETIAFLCVHCLCAFSTIVWANIMMIRDQLEYYVTLVRVNMCTCPLRRFGHGACWNYPIYMYVL